MSKSQLNALILLGVFVAGPLAGRMFTFGEPWNLLLTGCTLLIILFAFDQEGQRTVWQSVAFAGACGFCVALASPVLLQYFGIVTTGRVGYAITAGNAPPPELPFSWIPFIWLGSAVLFCVVDRSRMSGRIAAPAPTGFVPAPTPVVAPASFASPVPVREEVRPEPMLVPSAVAPQARAATATPFETVHPAAPVSYEPPPAASYEPAPAAPATLALQEQRIPDQPVLQQPTPIVPAPPPNAVPFPTGVGKAAVIYLNLVGEGLPVLRSVQAEHVGKDYYLIVEPVPPGERWQFQPGQIVRAQKKNLSNGKALVAVEEAPRAN